MKTNSIITAGALLVAVLYGLVATQGSVRLVLIAAGIILAPLVVLAPAEGMLAGSLAFGFIISGTVQYFGGIDQMHWLVALLYLVMLARLPLVVFSHDSINRQQKLTLISVSLLSYCGMSILSIAVNASPPLQAIVGLKHYLLPFTMTALIVFGKFAPDFWLAVWRWIPNLLILQLPVAMYQYFFVATGRSNVSALAISWDAIVGTFGGNPDGGGASGALAFFLCFGIVATLALRREKLISAERSWLAVASSLLVITIAEVKVVIIFLPIAFLAYERRKVLRSLPTAIGWIIGTSLFVPGLLLLYSVIHWGDSGLHLNSIGDIFDYTFRAETDTNFYNPLTRELSRSAAISIWWKENILSGDFLHVIFGHGPAATKISETIGYGELVKRYPFNLNTSTLSALLWDIGAFGTFALLAALSAVALAAFTNAQNVADKNPVLRAIYEGCGVGAVLLIVDIPYNLDVMSNAAVQMTMAMIFGVILTANRMNTQSIGAKS